MKNRGGAVGGTLSLSRLKAEIVITGCTLGYWLGVVGSYFVY